MKSLDAEQGTTLAELEMLAAHELFDPHAAATVAARREP